MKLFDFFKKNKKESNENSGIVVSRQNQNIYCELTWNRQIDGVIKLIGYNRALDLEILCSQNVFNRERYHSTNPSANIFIPRILFDIDWNFIFKDGMKLKNFKIKFFNYMDSPRVYSVIMECDNLKNIHVSDSFSSTSRVFIDPYELTDNLNKFFKFAENYK